MEDIRKWLDDDILLFGSCQYISHGDGTYTYVPVEDWVTGVLDENDNLVPILSNDK